VTRVVRRVGVAEHLRQPFSLSGLVRIIRQADLDGFGGQIVQGDRLVLAPACLNGQDARVADVERAPIAPAEFRALAASADGLGRPGVQRAGLMALLGHIDRAVPVGALGMDRPVRLLPGGEAAGVPRRPLHRVAHSEASGQRQVFAHADLVSVQQDRGARQSHGQREGKPDPLLVVTEHRGQAPANTTTVDPVLWLGRERGEDFLALAFGERPEVQLVVVPAEVGELSLHRMRGSAG
jgi:hypothetical protein